MRTMFGFILVIPLMIIIITGNFLRARGFYSETDVRTLTKTLYWVILPPLLIRTTFGSGKEVLSQGKFLAALTLVYILTVVLAAVGAIFLFHKLDRARIAVSVFSSIRSNNIYLGFPVIMLAMGEEGLNYASVYIAVSTVSLQLVSVISGEVTLFGKLSPSSVVEIFKRLLRNPILVSCVVGIGLAMAGLEKLPTVVDEAMKLMGSAATAVALLALGGALHFSSFSGVAAMVRGTWKDCIMKLLIHPILMWGLLSAFSVSGPLLKVTVMLSSMPSAVNCFIMAREMEMDSRYAADLVASTTVLGVISIPLWANLLGRI